LELENSPQTQEIAMLNLITKLFPGRSPAAHPARTTRLAVESLERRELLTVAPTIGITQTSSGEIRIQGGEGGDYASVSVVNLGGLNNWVWVELSNSYSCSHGPYIAFGRFPLAGVTGISFNGAGGDDEFVNLTGLNSIASGGFGDDHLVGGSGQDQFWGDSGNDVLEGNRGNDSLYGGIGSDILNGGDGNDYLNGGAGETSGVDYLTGGPGDDIFVDYSSYELFSVDVFTDFGADAGDKKVRYRAF
jgi:Ca2+-binding RTX toxin-like protein